MKVWITKYALSEGLYEAEVTISSGGMAREQLQYGCRYYHVEGRDWHKTREAALQRCEVMRQAKLKSLDKTRKRIEALRFDAM